MKFIPKAVKIIERIQESPTIFTLRLQLKSHSSTDRFAFSPGQFNMVYLYGVGEVPISIVSDPEDESIIDHTIRTVGRVTRGLGELSVGSYIGIRGPFGQGWPIANCIGKDILIVTGGLGCAPVVSVINYILRRRDEYGRLIIMQGVKHAADLIWRERYETWMQQSGVEVLIAADEADKNWPWHVGRVTQLCHRMYIEPDNTIVMMCGPEPMILASVECISNHGVADENFWISMERNMQCGVGHCGHCQLGEKFVCRNGPVFNYLDIKPFVSIKGI